MGIATFAGNCCWKGVFVKVIAPENVPLAAEFTIDPVQFPLPMKLAVLQPPNTQI